jgi:SAM-dependent methyltransferase
MTLYPLTRALLGLATPPLVVEFGAARAASQTGRPPLRSLVGDRPYLASDLTTGGGIDVVTDLHDLGLHSGAIGLILLLDTIEHVNDPVRTVRELARCLHPGGITLITTVFFFPIHEHPQDFWRFTAQGLAEVMSAFSRVHTREIGWSLLPHTVVGLGANEGVSPSLWDEAIRQIDGWAAGSATGWRERVLGWAPPALTQWAYRRFA